MGLALFCVINPVLGFSPFESGLNIIEFLLLLVSTTFIAIAGYLQNDLFDINPDSINKPGKNLVGRKFRVHIIQILYWVFNIIGILAGVFLSFTEFSVKVQARKSVVLTRTETFMLLAEQM